MGWCPRIVEVGTNSLMTTATPQLRQQLLKKPYITSHDMENLEYSPPLWKYY